MFSETIFARTAKDLALQLQESAIDHAAFEIALPVCELTKCRATCCHDGVVLSDEEAEILKNLGDAASVVTRENGSMKTRTVEASSTQLAEDFPEHFPKTRCVFLDDQHRCQWQLRAMEEGKPAWFYKPTSCWMHPLLLTYRDGRPLLTLVMREVDARGFASHTPCGRATEGVQPARQALKDELEMLTRLSGRDFFAELNAPSVT